ncbi:hypothetical protein ACWDOP_33070 [Nocardia sp. NPDC003693]
MISYTNFGNFDDDWDEHPTNVARRQPPPVRHTQPSAHVEIPAPTDPSSARSMQNVLVRGPVTMHLDRGLLPVRLEFSTAWNQQVGPNEVGRTLLQAYHTARYELIKRTVEANNGWPKEGLLYSCATPWRKQLCLMIETETWACYQDLLTSIRQIGNYRVNGQVYEYDEPVMTMAADKFMVNSIQVWPQWQGSSDPLAIEGEVLECARKIREIRPKYVVRGDYSQYSEAQLEEMHQQHRRRLVGQLRGM